MSISIVGVRNFTITNVENYYEGWKIELDEIKDLVTTNWSSGGYSGIIDELCKATNISVTHALKLFPPIQEVPLNEHTTGSVTKDFESTIIDAKEQLDVCLPLLNTLASGNNINMSNKLRYLLEHWNNGFIMFVERE